MTNHDNLFQQTDFVVGSQDPADSLGRFASRFGATNVVSVSAHAGPDPEILSGLAGRLMTATLDGIILLSAAGAGRLLEQASLLADPARFLAAIADSRMIVAGANAARVLARRQIESNRVLDEASDWRASLKQIASLPELANSRLVIESSILDLPLQSGLEARGTTVEPVAIVCSPWRKSGSGSLAAKCLAAIACEADGLAGIIDWLNELDNPNPVRPVLFSPSREVVESGGLLGLESWHLQTERPPGRWDRDEAMQMARRLW